MLNYWWNTTGNNSFMLLLSWIPKVYIDSFIILLDLKWTLFTNPIVEYKQIIILIYLLYLPEIIDFNNSVQTLDIVELN